jgi:hypothetical protein
LATIAAAQTITLASPTGGSVTTAFGASVQTSSLPAGPMAAAGSLQSQQGSSANGWLTWDSTTAPTWMSMDLRLQAWANSTVATSATTIAAVEVVLQVSNPTLRAARLALYRNHSATAGAPTPLLRIDVGDDGSYELTESMPNWLVSQVLLVGPTPLPIRLSAAMLVTGNQTAQGHLQVHWVPADSVSLAAPGCAGVFYEPQPMFSGDLQLSTVNGWPDSSLAVIGLSYAPVLFPAFPQTFCLLVPSPDLLILLPPIGVVTLVVPPAARPITLWTQAIPLNPGPPTTTNGYRVDLF